MKIQEIIDAVNQAALPFQADPEKTRDRILCGDPQQECTGVAVTVCATLEVMRQAAESGCNFIISHEGIWYNYEKSGSLDAVENEAVQAKLDYVRQHQLTVWRFHDAMHGFGSTARFGQPRTDGRDYIFYGIMKQLEWEPYLLSSPVKPLWYRIPRTPARRLGRQLLEKFALTGMRTVGDQNAEIETVFFAEHLMMGEKDLPRIEQARRADAMITLEILDNTLTEYVRDAVALGEPKIIYEMGHFNTEELGMRYMTQWLPPLIGPAVKVVFLQSGDEFGYLLRD